jgi:hypothetical protein
MFLMRYHFSSDVFAMEMDDGQTTPRGCFSCVLLVHVMSVSYWLAFCRIIGSWGSFSHDRLIFFCFNETIV